MNDAVDIIIIEDDEGLNNLIRITLETLGYRVATAFAGSAGMDLVIKNTGSILLLDYKLPDINALEFIEKLEKISVKTPFIIMTGRGDEKIAVELMKHGARDYITKGLNFLDILPGIIKQVREQINNEKRLIESENIIKENEEKYRGLFEKSMDGIIIHDMDGNIIDSNDRIAWMLGYSREEFLNLNIKELYSAEVADNPQKDFFYILKEGKNFYEMDFRKKSGTVFQAEVSSSNYTIQGKEVVQDIVRDISERKQYEQIIISSEEKFRNFFENAPSYCYMISPEGLVLNINKAALEALGYEKDEIVGENIMKIYHPESHAKVGEAFNRFMRTGIVENEELSIITKKGGRLIVLLGASSVKTRNNEILYSLSIQRDITLRKKIEHELEEKEKYYRTILHKMHEDILIINRDYIITDINNSLMNTTGLKRDDIIGRHCNEILLNSDKFKYALEDNFHFQSVFDGRNTKNWQGSLKTPNNKEFYADILFTPLLEEQDNINLVIVAIRDISDIMKAQEQIKASLIEKESLLREIHHRVKNNLQVISSMLGLQKGYLRDKKDLELFIDSQNRIRSMAMLHEHLYHSNDFSKLEFSKFLPVIFSDLEQVYNVDPSKLDITIDSGSIMIDMNGAVPVFQILNELISNSMKYAFTDGRKGNIKIELKSTAEKTYSMVYSDNGPGFPEGFIFPGKESLGLTLVEIFVKQLKGKIEISQETGLKFIITFKVII